MYEPCEAVVEQAIGARSLWARAWRGDDAAVTWPAPGGRPRTTYQRRRLSLRARAPEQHSGTPSSGVSVHAAFSFAVLPRVRGVQPVARTLHTAAPRLESQLRALPARLLATPARDAPSLARVVNRAEAAALHRSWYRPPIS